MTDSAPFKFVADLGSSVTNRVYERAGPWVKFGVGLAIIYIMLFATYWFSGRVLDVLGMIPGFQMIASRLRISGYREPQLSGPEMDRVANSGTPNAFYGQRSDTGTSDVVDGEARDRRLDARHDDSIYGSSAEGFQGF